MPGAKLGPAGLKDKKKYKSEIQMRRMNWNKVKWLTNVQLGWDFVLDHCSLINSQAFLSPTCSFSASSKPNFCMCTKFAMWLQKVAKFTEKPSFSTSPDSTPTGQP